MDIQEANHVQRIEENISTPPLVRFGVKFHDL